MVTTLIDEVMGYYEQGHHTVIMDGIKHFVFNGVYIEMGNQHRRNFMKKVKQIFPSV